MRTERSAGGVQDEAAVMRTFVRGRVARKPEFSQTMRRSRRLPDRRDRRGTGAGEQAAEGLPLHRGGGRAARADEARRCAFNLTEGDLIQAVGDIGPERPEAKRQEVVVSEPVRLRARMAVAA